MNGKQARMLHRMGTGKAERVWWHTLTHTEKGRLRKAFDACPYMMHPSLPTTVAAVQRKPSFTHWRC